MVHEILVWPHPVLKQKAQPVAKVDDEIRTLIKDMFESMYAADGVGLAAPQIGVLKTVIVLDTTPKQPTSRPMAMVNPEIIEVNGKRVYKEGCLSVPGEAEDVERADTIKVRFLDENGETQVIHADALLSTAVQHEMDHLKGVMFVDHISSMKREMIRKRMKRVQQVMAEEKAETAAQAPEPSKRKRAEAR